MTGDIGILRTGRPATPSEMLQLRAGPLTLTWDHGAVRWVRLGQHELLREIYVAVRDAHWGTVPGAMRDFRLKQRDDAFALSCVWRHREEAIDFQWTSRIEGKRNGTLRFEMDGEVLSTYASNRTGCCLLHPAEVAGQPCRLQTVDGERSEGNWPLAVSAHQPFLNMRSIAHQVADGLWAKVTFEGGVFEMEDQRNWTDASFKSYAPPLIREDLPLTLRAGDKLHQVITLTLEGKPTAVRAEADDQPGRIDLSRGIGTRLPKLGVSISSQPLTLTDDELERLRALKLHHLRVELPLHHSDWPQRLERATLEAKALGIGLEAALAVDLNAEEQLEALAEVAETLSPPVWAWMLFRKADARPVSSAVLVQARELLQPNTPDALFGSGSAVDYVEINRAHPPVEADLVSYGLCPQVHAFDDASLMETPPTQATLALDARRIIGSRPQLVSPITLRRRFEPVFQDYPATPGPDGAQLVAQIAPRQVALIGAAWTVLSIKNLAESGVDYATYFETAGWLGLQDAADGPEPPEAFHRPEGGVYPPYLILAWLAEHQDPWVRQVMALPGAPVQGIALAQKRDISLILANSSPDTQRVTLPYGESWHVRQRLNEKTVERAMFHSDVFLAAEPHVAATGEVTLAPYECVYLETRI